MRLHRQASGMYFHRFKIVVPEGYDHGKRLDSFGKEHRKAFDYYDNEITEKNYGLVTTKLESGQKLKVKVFQIEKTVTSEDCLAKLRSEKAIFVGAQGALLAWEQKKEELPVNRWSVSLDEKDALWKDAGGRHWVPRVDRFSGGEFGFRLRPLRGRLGRRPLPPLLLRRIVLRLIWPLNQVIFGAGFFYILQEGAYSCKIKGVRTS